MTHTERLLYRSRHLLWIVAALLFLGGGLTVAFLQIDHAQTRANHLAAEANLRGNAVSTLAGDVRALREQVKAAGHTPVAPDPTKAVAHLADRAQVPVPIPGPPGPKGDTGATGKPAPTVTPSPGAAGRPGTDSTVPGPQGAQGVPGADSTVPGPQGERGEQGPPPDGWTYTDGAGVSYECTPDSGGGTHFTCRATSTPAPNKGGGGLLGAGLLASTAMYRRL